MKVRLADGVNGRFHPHDFSGLDRYNSRTYGSSSNRMLRSTGCRVGVVMAYSLKPETEFRPLAALGPNESWFVLDCGRRRRSGPSDE